MQEQNHWKKEVWNLIRSVPKLKSSNRFPTYSQIRKQIWESYEDVIYEHICLWVDEIDEDPIPFDYESVYHAIEEYMDWLASQLCDKGVVRSSETYAKIEEIRTKYF